MRKLIIHLGSDLICFYLILSILSQVLLVSLLTSSCLGQGHEGQKGKKMQLHGRSAIQRVIGFDVNESHCSCKKH